MTWRSLRQRSPLSAEGLKYNFLAKIAENLANLLHMPAQVLGEDEGLMSHVQKQENQLAEQRQLLAQLGDQLNHLRGDVRKILELIHARLE